MIRCLLVLVLLAQWIAAPAVADIYGEEEDARTTDSTVPRYEPDQEAVRSLLLPGWSQHRQGASGAGWGFTAIAVTTFFFMIGTWEVPLIGSEDDNFGQVFAGVLYGLNAVVSAFDAHGRAVESNRENGWDLGPQAFHGDRGFRLGLVQVRF